MPFLNNYCENTELNIDLCKSRTYFEASISSAYKNKNDFRMHFLRETMFKNNVSLIKVFLKMYIYIY